MTALVTCLLGLSLLAQSTGMITGRVVSRDGTPAVNTRVMVIESQDAAGAADVIVSFATTDASGNYRVQNIPPGRYVVAAGFVDHPSFYPAGAHRMNAAIVAVSAGAVREGIDIVEAQVFRVTGRVIVQGKDQMVSGRGRQIRLMFKNGLAEYAPIQADGTYEFPKMPPGEYFATVNPGIVMPSVRITVKDRDVSDVELVVPRVKTVMGKVSIDGGGPPPFGIAILLDDSASEDVRMSAFGNLKLRDHSFRMTLPEGGLGRVSIKAIPLDYPAYRVRSFVYGTVNLLKESLTISASDRDELLVVLEPALTR